MKGSDSRMDGWCRSIVGWWGASLSPLSGTNSSWIVVFLCVLGSPHLNDRSRGRQSLSMSHPAKPSFPNGACPSKNLKQSLTSILWEKMTRFHNKRGACKDTSNGNLLRSLLLIMKTLVFLPGTDDFHFGDRFWYHGLCSKKQGKHFNIISTPRPGCSYNDSAFHTVIFKGL